MKMKKEGSRWEAQERQVSSCRNQQCSSVQPWCMSPIPNVSRWPLGTAFLAAVGWRLLWQHSMLMTKHHVCTPMKDAADQGNDKAAIFGLQ